MRSVEYAFEIIGYRGHILSWKKEAALFCKLDCTPLETDFLLTNGLLKEVVFEYPFRPSLFQRAGYVACKVVAAHPDAKKREAQRKKWTQEDSKYLTVTHLLRGIALYLTEYEAINAQAAIENRLSEIGELVGLALHSRDRPGRYGGL